MFIIGTISFFVSIYLIPYLISICSLLKSDLFLTYFRLVPYLIFTRLISIVKCFELKDCSYSYRIHSKNTVIKDIFSFRFIHYLSLTCSLLKSDLFLTYLRLVPYLIFTRLIAIVKCFELKDRSYSYRIHSENTVIKDSNVKNLVIKDNNVENLVTWKTLSIIRFTNRVYH